MSPGNVDLSLSVVLLIDLDPGCGSRLLAQDERQEDSRILDD